MSTDIQLKGDSLRRQLASSQAYAAEHDLELVEDSDLRDIGVSAFKGANITTGALGKFLAAVREGQIESGSYLLVESLDRITRQKLIQSQALFLQIINSGVNLVTLADRRVYHAGSNDISDFIYSLFSMARANEESEMKSKRLAAAWGNKRANAHRRKLTSICPAWLRLNKETNTFNVIPERAEVVRSIFEDSAAGIGNYTITRRLNERGIAHFGKSGGWQKSYVAKILNNPAVIGQYQPAKLDANRKRVPDGAIITDYFPSIIDEMLFFRARSARAERDIRASGKGRGRKGSSVTNLFSQLLRCEYCDHKIIVEDKGPKPKGGKYLVCDGVKRGFGCANKRWRYEDFEASFLAFVRELDLDRILSDDVSAAARAKLDQEVASHEGELKAKQIEQEKAYQLFQATDQSAFVAKKIAENELRIAELQSILQQKQKERISLSAATTRLYESKTEIKALLDRFKRHDENDDIYKLRSQIATRLRAIVDKVFVAGSGSVPHIERAIAELQKREPRPNDKIAQFRRELKKPAAARRFFTAIFKDGTVRHVVPHQTDPLRVIAQDIGSIEGLQHSGQDSLLAQAQGSDLVAALQAVAEPSRAARTRRTGR